MVQSRESINVLRNKYHTDSLYMVNARCDIKEPLDLAANSGLIVAVIKREDPMGNTGRWFVDAGGERTKRVYDHCNYLTHLSRLKQR